MTANKKGMENSEQIPDNSENEEEKHQVQKSKSQRKMKRLILSKNMLLLQKQNAEGDPKEV